MHREEDTQDMPVKFWSVVSVGMYDQSLSRLRKQKEDTMNTGIVTSMRQGIGAVLQG